MSDAVPFSGAWGGKSSIQFDDFIYSNKECWRLGTWAL